MSWRNDFGGVTALQRLEGSKERRAGCELSMAGREEEEEERRGQAGLCP